MTRTGQTDLSGRLALLLLLVFGLGTVPPLTAQPRVGEVAEAAGQVTSTEVTGQMRELTMGDDVFLLSKIATGKLSSARLTFGRDCSIQIDENSPGVLLDWPKVDETNRCNSSRLFVLAGRVRVALAPGSRASMLVETVSTLIGVKGTDVRVAVDHRGATVVAVWEGEVTVTSKSGGELVLRAPRMTVVEPGRPPTPPAFIDPEGGLQFPDRDEPGPGAEPPLENRPPDRGPVGLRDWP